MSSHASLHARQLRCHVSHAEHNLQNPQPVQSSFGGSQFCEICQIGHNGWTSVRRLGWSTCRGVDVICLWRTKKEAGTKIRNATKKSPVALNGWGVNWLQEGKPTTLSGWHQKQETHSTHLENMANQQPTSLLHLESQVCCQTKHPNDIELSEVWNSSACRNLEGLKASCSSVCFLWLVLKFTHMVPQFWTQS